MFLCVRVLILVLSSVFSECCLLRVSVRFFTSLREITGRKEVVVEFSGKRKVTVRVVLDRLCRRFGADFVEYVFNKESGDVRGFLQFLVNGRSLSLEKGLDTLLCDGDVLAIVPPVGGG